MPYDLEAIFSQLHSRREFIKLFGKGLGYGALASMLPACAGRDSENADDEQPGDSIPAPSAEYSVLKRTSFGVHRDALSEIQSTGIEAYLERQLNFADIHDGDLESTIQTLFPLSLQTPAQLITGFPDNIYPVALQMAGATQYRQIFSQRQLYEIMVEFWSDHFNIHLVNGLGPTLKPQDDQQVIRQHALGNFRDLLHASAKSPAMLFYLDNFFNQAAAPNENYARELMELHTLGVEGGYDEDDVKEVARCFTGWSFHFPDDAPNEYGIFNYVDVIHDHDDKQVLGETISLAGPYDAERVLDKLADHPSTARFIAGKLCRRFISDEPAQETVDAVASAFTRSGGDIKDTLRALFATSAFRDSADLKFTRPAEFLAGLIRALAPDTPYPSDEGQLFFFAQSIMGHLPFYWPTPDGYPDEQGYWASTGGLLNRWRLSFLSLANILSAELDMIEVDYAPMLNGADTLNGIVDALTENLLMRPLSGGDRERILDWLTGEYNKTRNESLNRNEVEFASALMAAVFISSAYFQLR